MAALWRNIDNLIDMGCFILSFCGLGLALRLTIGIQYPVERSRNRGPTTCHCEETNDEAISSAHRDRRAIARDDPQGLSHYEEDSESVNHFSACPETSRNELAPKGLDIPAQGKPDRA